MENPIIKIRVIFSYSSLALCVCACAAVKVDPQVIGQCFDIERESFLYTYDSCGAAGKATCYGIQSYGVATNELAKKHIPESKSVLEANKKHWDIMIKRGASFQLRSKGKYVGTVGKGTRIKILHMSSKWSTARKWETTAEIMSGPFTGTFVALPADRHLLGPAWVRGYPLPGKINTPIFDDKLLSLSRCSN